MTKTYSVRRPGNTSWTDTDSLRTARRELALANRTVAQGHLIVDNRTGTIVEPTR